MNDKTVATTLATAPSPAPSLAQGDLATWVVGTAASVIATLLWLRRRTSRDTTEIAKDRAEESLIKTLRAERDQAMNDAREAWARRTTDAEQIARLSARNEYLEKDVKRLHADIVELQIRLQPPASNGGLNISPLQGGF